MTDTTQTPIRPADRFLVFGAPAVEEPEIEDVVARLKSGWLGTGPRVHRFEKDFAAYKGVQNVAALSSCTAALNLSMVAEDLQPGDEVITISVTFAATVNAIIHAGATPILADIDPETFNIDPHQVEANITDNTRAILPVHYFARRSCNMDHLVVMANTHDHTSLRIAPTARAARWIISRCALCMGFRV